MNQTPANSPEPVDDRVWEAGWDDHRVRQQRRLARLTLAQKLDWLEEAHALARHLAERKKLRDAASNE